jgi:hypothetical protein
MTYRPANDDQPCQCCYCQASLLMSSPALVGKVVWLGKEVDEE